MIPTQETIQKASQILAEIERLRTEMLSLFGGPATAVAVAVAAPRVGRPPKAAKAAKAPKAASPAPETGKPGKRRNMTAAGRARIAAAARARWARFHAARKGTATR